MTREKRQARDEDPWLTTMEVAARLRMDTAHTLNHWAYQGTGPKFIKVGKRRLYRLSAVVAWEHQREAGA